MEKVAVSWSGGKDSVLALYELYRDESLRPARLFSSVTEGYERITMHGVRRELVREQASVLGLELDEIYIPRDCSNEVYEARMVEALHQYQNDGITGMVFGDIFLEEVREYREKNLLEIGFHAYFPLWGRETEELVLDFIEDGFRAIVVCVDGDRLDGSFVGRELDEQFLADLPSSVDPAGENGEYHCFVWNGPLFDDQISVEVGDVMKREGFYFCDLLPAD